MSNICSWIDAYIHHHRPPVCHTHDVKYKAGMNMFAFLLAQDFLPKLPHHAAEKRPI